MATEFSDFVGGQTPLDLGMSIARLALRFGEVMRATAHPDGRPESDTTHTVMLCLLVAELAQWEGLDVGLCVQLALVHDLPETYAGDVSTARELSPEERAAKDRREAAAVERIESEFGAESWTATMLRRYEAQDEPEARMVRFADKILPKLTHALNGGIRIQAISMSPDEAAERHKRQGAKFEALNRGLAVTPAMFYAAHEAAVAAYRERLAEGPHDGGFQSHGFTVARGNVYFTGETEDGELLNCMAKMCDGTFGLWRLSDSADALRLELCHRVYNLPRWAGEHGPFGTFCVGPHLELVSYLAGKLAEARDLNDEAVALAKRFGALHDVGERLGIGDPSGPIVEAMPDLKREAERHQHAVSRLFVRDLDGWLMDGVMAAAQVVHDADRLARTVERRAIFGDHSRDMESSLAPGMLRELGIESMHVTGWSDAPQRVDVLTLRYNGGDEHIHFQHSAEALLRLIEGKAAGEAPAGDEAHGGEIRR